MQEISSITKENEIDVIYGMLNLREDLVQETKK